MRGRSVAVYQVGKRRRAYPSCCPPFLSKTGVCRSMYQIQFIEPQYAFFKMTRRRHKRRQSLGLKGVQLIPVSLFYFKPLHGRRIIERSQTHGVSVILFIWSINTTERPDKLKLYWQPTRNYRKNKNK